LLLHLRVLHDLLSDDLAVAFERSMLFILELSLLLFFFLLSFDHSKEVVAFSFGLLGHHGFALIELSLAGELKFSGSLRGLLSC